MSVKVEVFSSPGCSKCGKAKVVLRDIAKKVGEDRVKWREVNILDDIDYAIKLGVLTTPSIAIDDELIYTSLPSEKNLRKELLRRLDKENTSEERD